MLTQATALALAALVVTPARGAGADVGDARAAQTRLFNQVYTFTPYASREQWEARAARLRRRILVSAGLWPMPARTPLNAHVFDRTEADGYSVEKVFFESTPGFFVTGNLYRPLARSAPHPAVLVPHGHWPYGRLENTEASSFPAAASNLAQQGYVVFSYDLVGYNDSLQVPHRTFAEPRHELWGISVAGLQIWNGIRALDFLTSLPDVDASRIGCTGPSGGGTQTFLLTAVDDRIAAAVPVNMVSAHMQGGCLCENAPGLRIDTSNVELAALAAPRPLLLVSATGDWTADTPRVELPAIRSVYRLFGLPEDVDAVQNDAPHNFNRASREAMYAWFARWLMGRRDARIEEQPYQPLPLRRLLVFYGRALPEGALDAPGLVRSLMTASQAGLSALWPTNQKMQDRFREVMRPALAEAVAAEAPLASGLRVERRGDEAGATAWTIGRSAIGDRVPALLWPAASSSPPAVAVVVHERGYRALLDPGDATAALLASLRARHHAVIAIDAFQTGSAIAPRDRRGRFFTTYNRTDDAERVQDVLTALAFARSRYPRSPIHLVGVGHAGLWCLLARALWPEPICAALDVAGFDSESDDAFVRGLFIPLLRRVGDVRTAVALAAPAPLLLHGTAGRFQTQAVVALYRDLASPRSLRVESQPLDPESVVSWLEGSGKP